MNPFTTAKALRPATFHMELEAHLQHGVVISTPDAFLMGRPIAKDADHTLQADVWHQFPREDQNCWMVWAAAGDLSTIWQWVPYPLKWLAWARREGELRFYSFDSVNARLANRDNLR